ncbi:unnamed protein product [Penicillium salamii]|nr:unnamed protein product [Penicillium salamii]
MPPRQEIQGAKRLKLKHRILEGWHSIALDTWFYEIVALLFSAGCYCAIFFVLRAYDGKPSPKFSHGLTLNTIVSVLSTASKSSLIFTVSECIGQLRWIQFKKSPTPLAHIQTYDSASRGPWGALLIFSQDKGRSLVTIGALITLLALAFDPFVQQILTYPTREVIVTSSHATVKQSQKVDYYSHWEMFFDALSGAPYSKSFPIDPICPSSSCSWPLFRSVEVCSKCEDVTASATLVGCGPVAFNSSIHEEQSTSCHVSLPDRNSSSSPVSITWNKGIDMDAESNLGNDQSFGGQPGWFQMAFPYDILWYTHTMRLSSEDKLNKNPLSMTETSILGVKNPVSAVARAQLSLAQNETLHPEEGLRIVNVTECIMSYCARAYEVSVKDGIPRTDIKAEDYGHIYVSTESKLCWKPVMNTSIGSTPDERIDHGFCFNHPGESLQIISTTLTDTVSHIFAWVFSVTSQSWTWQLGGDLWWTPLHGKVIAFTGLDGIMQKMALAVSKFLRDISNHTIAGNSTISQSHVDVQWPWIALPGILFILSTLLLLSTALLTNDHQVSLWKTSLLPILFNSPGDRIATDNTMSSLKNMEKTAEDINLRLKTSSAGRKLVLQH